MSPKTPSNTHLPAPLSPRSPERRHLHALLGALWDGDELTPEAPATLARWRRGLSLNPWESPVLSMEIAETLQERESPEGKAQEAVFHALALYSAHQQSVPTPVHTIGREAHRAGTTVGRALRDLCARNVSSSEDDEESTAEGDSEKASKTEPWRHKNNKGVVRLMEAAVTAHSVPELIGHLRHVISLLRKEALPLDYVHLADDIRTWHTQYRGAVANQWAMDFYTPISPQNDPDIDNTDEEH